MTAHCQVAAAIARRLELGPEVQQPLLHVFSRWDGTGIPGGTGGEELPRRSGSSTSPRSPRSTIASAASTPRSRSHAIAPGGQFDPRVVEAFADCARELLDGLAEESSWDAVIAAEPGLAKALAGDRLDAALEAVADFGDLKSPWFTGHSRGVARLAAAAAREAGLPADAVTELRRAALLHDLGRTGVPNTIWDKPGPLTDAERERVRLHPYYTERMLARPEALARLGAIAAAHHERLDGSGYHRSLPGSALSPSARMLAAADVYHAMTEARPHREAARGRCGGSRAARRSARRTDRRRRGGGRPRPPPVTRARALRDRARPAGLTARELEVLLLVARGASSRDVARQLVIADKTARNHIEHIYTKLGGLHPRGGIALRDAPRARRLTARSWGECLTTGRTAGPYVAAMLQLDRSPRDTRPSDGRGLGPLGRLGRWAATHRRTVVLAWVVRRRRASACSLRAPSTRCPGAAGRPMARSPWRPAV